MGNWQLAMSNEQWPVVGGPSKARAKADMLHRNTSIPSKTGQPMAAVRLSLSGKSLFIATCPNISHLSCKGSSPAAARLAEHFPALFSHRRATAGEVLARGGLEGTASPKEAAPPRSSPFKVFSLQGLLPPRSSSFKVFSLQGLLPSRSYPSAEAFSHAETARMPEDSVV